MLHRFARPLLVIGSVAIVFAVRAYHIAERGPIDRVWPFIFLGLFIGVVAVAIGLPYVPAHAATAATSASITSVVTAGVGSLALVIDPGLFPRFVLIASVIVVLPWMVLCWWLAERGHRNSRLAMKVVAIGDSDELDTLSNDAALAFPAPELAYTLVATVPTGTGIDELERVLEEHEVTLIVLGVRALDDDRLLATVERHHHRGVRVRTMEQFYEQWMGKLPLWSLQRSALLTDVTTIHELAFSRLKRTMDLAFGAIGLVPLLVAIPLVWIGNLFGNRGPLFYSQPRTGLNNEVFRIRKFRTMRPDADAITSWTSENDPRITRFGMVLRRSHLDELPQVLDMLRGTLSLVGPRPEQPHYVEQLEQSLPFYATRHVVKPGLTGWAQVKFRYSASEHDTREKLQYDLYYIRNQSLVLDLKVIKRTITQVLFGGGR
jgi:lipopolysaccharide/colanic/teichoic acid biosynthesis glycosyltransferase